MAAEKTYENKIKKFLDENKCWYVKFFANSFTKVGIPDLLACVNRYFVAIEVKAPNGTPSELQKYNVTRINKCGGIAVIVEPAHYTDLTYMLKCLMYNDDVQAKEIRNKINASWGI